MNITKNESKKFKIFMIVAYLLPMVLGIFMGIQHNKGFEVSAYPNAQMFYPAAGVMLGLLIVDKTKQLTKKFYIGFLILTVFMILNVFYTFFMPSKDVNVSGQYIIIAGSVLLWILYFLDKKNIREKNGFKFQNAKKSFALILIFITLYVMRIIGASLIEGSLGEVFANLGIVNLVIFITLPLNFFFVFAAFLGEEYGWRYYLQPLLMEKIGPKKGILLLGVMWGLWHLPINIFFYSPETWGQSIVCQISTCIGLGIFFGYAYMKTNNIWVPVILHFLNNNMIPVFTGSANISNQVIKWEDCLVLIILNLILFVPFIFTKQFKKKEEIKNSIS